MERNVQTIIKEKNAGVTVLSYLLERFPYRSEEQWLNSITTEQLTVNSLPVTAEQVLKTDDLISLDLSDVEEPKVNTDYKVVYEDEWLLVIDKPGDLPVHPGGPFYCHTLWYMLKDKYPNLHLISRLDRETSGLMLIALHPKVARSLSKQMEKRKITKEYLVLVEGDFPEYISAPGFISYNEDSSVYKKMKYTHDEDYQSHGKIGCFTEFHCIEKANDLSLVKCKLHTGRRHQIRLTINSLGYPVVGDKIYGIDDSSYIRFVEKRITEKDYSLLKLRRQALHSHILSFYHPKEKAHVELTSSLPKDIRSLIHKE